MLAKIQDEIDEKKLKIIDIQNTINELYSDTNIIPPKRERYDQFDKRCPRECGHFNGGNLSCRHHCGTSVYQTHEREKELRDTQYVSHDLRLNNGEGLIDAAFLNNKTRWICYNI